MPSSRKASRTWAGVLSSLVLGLTLAVSGCSGDDDPGDANSPSGDSSLQDPSAPPTFKVEPVVKVGTVVGRISKKHRDSAERQISRAVMRWIDRAYLSTDQSTVRHAFAGFSHDMKKRAFRDRAVMSNAGISGITQISPSSLHVTTDMLGVKGLPTGATSRIQLRYRTIGDERHHVTVGGRVSLIHDSRGWHVISYDVHRGVR
jgi:hypothetical protein